MQGHKFTICHHAHGVLAANYVGRFKLSENATLQRIQFSCSSATAATLDFGTAADPDGIIDGAAIGQSDAVNILERAQFNGVLYTDVSDIEHVVLQAGQVYVFTIIHASAANVDLVFELLE